MRNLRENIYLKTNYLSLDEFDEMLNPFSGPLSELKNFDKGIVNIASMNLLREAVKWRNQIILKFETYLKDLNKFEEFFNSLEKDEKEVFEDIESLIVKGPWFGRFGPSGFGPEEDIFGEKWNYTKK